MRACGRACVRACVCVLYTSILRFPIQLLFCHHINKFMQGEELNKQYAFIPVLKFASCRILNHTYSYSRISMARTPLGPLKYVRGRGISS